MHVLAHTGHRGRTNGYRNSWFGDDAVPVPAPSFLDTKEALGVKYQAANDASRSNIKGAYVGWKVRSTNLLHHTDEDIERVKTEIAKLTPYVESTGPRDPGDGFRWIDMRATLGRGIIVIPPVGWTPAVDLMRMTTGDSTLIATEDINQVRDNAGPGKPGFVLYEPQAGWKQGEGSSVDIPELDKAATKTIVLVAGVTVAVVGLGYLLLKK